MTGASELRQLLRSMRRELLAQCRDDSARALVIRSLEAVEEHLRAAILASRRAP